MAKNLNFKRSQPPHPDNSRSNSAVNLKPFIKLTYQGQELIFELQDDTYNLGRDPGWSDFKIPDEWKVISDHHAILRKEGEDFPFYDGDGQQPSTNGTFFQGSPIDGSRGHLLSNGNQIKIGKKLNDQVLLTYFNPAATQPNYTPTTVSE